MTEERELTGRERRLANLKPFSPGDPRINRGGRPVSTITKSLRRLMSAPESESDDSRSKADELAGLLYDIATGKAKATNVQLAALKEIVDRIEGRPRQSISLDLDADARRERKLSAFMQECERDGDPLSREEAIAALAQEDSDFEDYE